jgi:hypothetical protein
MHQSNISLKEIERKAFRSTYQDGLWDITWGIWLFAWAFIPLLEYWGISRFLGYPILLLPAVIIWLGKRHITAPRIGVARFGAERQQRRMKLFLAIAFFVCVTWGLAMVIRWIGSPNALRNEGWIPVADLAMGLIITLMLITVAYYMDFRRMYIYAILVGAGIPVAGILDRYVGEPLNDIIVFGIPSVIIINFGLILLIRFVLRYPRVDVEVANGC